MGKIKRTEALALLHEILAACRETVIMNCVSLDPAISLIKKVDRDYQIRMKCDLDNYSRNCIGPILGKHQLEMKEENGFVILYTKI